MFASKRDLAVELRRLLGVVERRDKLKRVVLARTIGVSPSSLYAYLDGTTLPSADVLERLLDVLDVLEVVDVQRQQLVAARDALDPRIELSLRGERHYQNSDRVRSYAHGFSLSSVRHWGLINEFLTSGSERGAWEVVAALRGERPLAGRDDAVVRFASDLRFTA